jgi:type IV pilus assembly protein PilV
VTFGDRIRGNGQRGSALVEVMVSVLLFSVGIIGLVRMLGTAVKDTGDVEFRAAAATLADETIGRMWVDRGNLVAHAVVDDPVAALPGGTRTVAVNGNVVTVTVSWQPPGEPRTRSHVTVATLASN